MPRKRIRRRRRFSATPLLIIALLVAAIVWATYPRTRRLHRQPLAVPVAAVPSASPAPQTPAPILTPSILPAAMPSPSLPAAPIAGAQQVAIIIDDCGQWLSTERALIAIPIPLTLSVLPHVRYTQTIAQEATEAGKGVMMHLPMEPLSHINPGPGEIRIAMSDAEITAQTQDDLEQVPTAKGVNNHEGSAASADPRVMQDVMAVIKEHGLFFIDSRTSAQTVGAQTAAAAGVPSASRSVFLDDQADVASTEAMLERTVEVAETKGSAIAIGHPKPSTLEALRTMYPKMRTEGVTFVLASQLVH